MSCPTCGSPEPQLQSMRGSACTDAFHEVPKADPDKHIRYVTLSVQDEEGRPLLSLGAEVTIKRSENSQCFQAVDGDFLGYGTTPNEALADWFWEALRNVKPIA